MDECAGFTSDKLQEEKFRDVIGCVSQFDVLLKGVRLCEERYWVGDGRIWRPNERAS